MKKLAMVVLFLGFFAGSAFAAGNNSSTGQTDCQCGNCLPQTPSSGSFNTLFPNHEVKAPVGG